MRQPFADKIIKLCHMYMSTVYNIMSTAYMSTATYPTLKPRCDRHDIQIKKILHPGVNNEYVVNKSNKHYIN